MLRLSLCVGRPDAAIPEYGVVNSLLRTGAASFPLCRALCHGGVTRWSAAEDALVIIRERKGDRRTDRQREREGEREGDGGAWQRAMGQARITCAVVVGFVGRGEGRGAGEGEGVPPLALRSASASPYALSRLCRVWCLGLLQL